MTSVIKIGEFEASVSELREDVRIAKQKYRRHEYCFGYHTVQGLLDRIQELELELEKHQPLCIIDGKEIYAGDKCIRTQYMMNEALFKYNQQTDEVTAECMYTDSDGDNYLCFTEGGNCWVSGPSDFRINVRKKS